MRRTLRTLAALAMVALISAGCSNAPAGADIGSSGGNNIVIQSLSSSSTSAGAGTGSSGGNTAAATHSNAPAEIGAGGASSQITAAPSKTSSNAAAGTGSDATNREQAVKFAECMRANGVKQFPDPDASGQLTIDAIANGSSLDTNSAAFKQAIGACKDLEPPGFTGSKRSPEQQKAALTFAQCIRDNGVKDFPDPAPDAPLIDTNRIPSAARNGGMSILRAAMQKCGRFAANAGVTGGK
jgi:hypothetical protein